MKRKSLHLAVDFFLLGAVVPLSLMLLWHTVIERSSSAASQGAFVKLAFILWPASIQILVVPHAHGEWGYALTIAILVLQNAILYSVIALLIHWLVCRRREHHIRQSR